MQQEAYINTKDCAIGKIWFWWVLLRALFAQRMSTHPLRSKYLISEYAASNFYAKLKPNFDHGLGLNPTRDRQ